MQGEAEGGGAAVGQHGLQHLGGQLGGHGDTEAWLVMARCRDCQGRWTHHIITHIITSQAHIKEITNIFSISATFIS